MNTINSLSGGKTSSYLAVHWPADYEIFSLVCVDDSKCGHWDKTIMKYANDKLSNYQSTFGEFIGTAENPIILKTMMDLEQKLGKEIIWVRGDSFDKAIQRKKALPNQQNRWCTTELKMKPIFEWCYTHLEFPIKMRVGFRMDEKERIERFTTSFKTSLQANKVKYWRHKWVFIEWREGDFVLINTSHEQIQKFWQEDKQGIIFPKDSNCQNCFWKNEQQILRNSITCPPQINWANNIENKYKRRFRFDNSIEQILRMPMQLDFFESDGISSSCQMGECLS
jgi:hypothetical protein